MKKIMRYNVLYKYFLSYTLIFFIPFVVLGVVMYHNAVINLQKEVETSNVNKLNQVKDMTDMRMKELGNIASWITYDSRLTPFKLRNNEYDLIEAIDELGRYKAHSAIIEEVLLYLRGEDIIYSSSGLSSIDTLTQRYYQFERWDEKEFIKDINTAQTAIIRPAEQIVINQNADKKMLTYLFPIPTKKFNPYGTVIFLINEAKLTNLIEDILGEFHGSVYILDEDKNILASKNKGISLDDESGIQLIQNHSAPGIKSIEWNNEKFSLSSVRSVTTGWDFLTIMPTDQFLSRVIQMKIFILFIFSILVIIGLGTAIILSKNQYRPIRNLADFAKTYGSQSPKSHEKNELELIHETIDGAFGDNKNLLEQIDAQRPLVREQSLIKLLKGDFKERKETDDLFTFHQLQMPGSYFFVMLISIGDHLKSHIPAQDRDEILEKLSQFPFHGGIGYGVELIHDNAIALIINMDEMKEDFKQKQEAVAHPLLVFLREFDSISPMITIGKTYRDMMQVNRSFIEASAAMEYKVKGGKNNLIFFDEINDFQEQISWYPIEEQVKFVQSLKQGDHAVAQETLKVMMNSIAEREQSILLLKCMCFDVINTLFRTLNEMNLSEYSKKIKGLLEFGSLQELEGRLNDLVLEICGVVDRNKESKNTNLRNEIVNYIQNHFKSFDLSLEKAAEQFGLSVSYLSRFFKDQMGSTFTDYVVYLRFEEVKRELKHSDKPIKEIIKGTGYMGISNFIEKFKKIEGITPGKYRKLHSSRDN